MPYLVNNGGNRIYFYLSTVYIRSMLEIHMGKILKNRTTPLFLILALSISANCLPSHAQGNQVLHGRVEDQGAKEAPTGLRRTDLPTNGPDPFSDDKPDDQQQMLEPSSEAFKMEPVRKPQKGFGLSASEHVNNNPTKAMAPMNPMMQPYDGEAEPMMPAPIPQQPMPGNVQQNDPDSSPDMQLAWDMWHKRVAEAIYTRFNFLAKLGFKHSPPLLCKVSYVVSRDGHIQNIQVTQKSTNVLFNVIVFQTVKSLDGDMNLLQFPPGSRRMFVPKVGTFTQNYGGDGFRYTVGDRETIQGQQGR